MSDLRQDHEEWTRRHRVARDVFIPWLSSVRSLQGSTVLELGSGQGAVTTAFADVVARHIAYDIDEDAVAIARSKLDQRGIDNVEMQTVAPGRMRDALDEHRGSLDVLLLYTVLEHMTVDERLETLEIAPELLRPGGVIAVVETPNRLVPLDHHTSQLPFFSQLPDALALRYWQRSEREDYLSAMGQAAEMGDAAVAEALTRWGRAASFHEFEVVFGDLQRHVIAANFDPMLLAERPVLFEELALARMLERIRPDLPPCFSRCWIDMVISPEPVDPAGVRFVWPWTMETDYEDGARWTRWDNIELFADRPFAPSLPCPTNRLVIGAVMPEGASTVTVRADGREWHAPLLGAAGDARYATVDFGGSVVGPEITFDRSGYLIYLGYEGPADRGLQPS